MGTRCTTVVMEDGEPILAIYRQLDGYLNGHGRELKEFLAPLRIVNGIRWTDDGPEKQIANGMGCLAAQLLAHLKINCHHKPTGLPEAGNIYVVPFRQEEFYHYVISNKGEQILLTVFADGGKIYEGPVQKFDPKMKWSDEDE